MAQEIKNPSENLRKRTLFFRNLNDTIEEEDLMEVFSKVLPEVKIVDVRVIRDENGVKRGISFVDVENQEMAERSLKLNNHHLKGSALKVELSKPPSEGDKDEYTLFVTNLPFTASESMLRDHFLKHFQKLEIDEVRLPRHTGTNKVKGFAYVQLRDRRIVPQVIQAVNKTKLDGRTITVEKS